jgi:hypothetical protein
MAMQAVTTEREPGVDWVPGDGIPWVCPQCWFILGVSSVPQSVALRNMRAHIASGHIKQIENSDDEAQEQLDAQCGELQAEEGESDGCSAPSHSSIRRKVWKVGDLRRDRKDIECEECHKLFRDDRIERHLFLRHGIQPQSPQTHRSALPSILRQPASVAHLDISPVPVEKLAFVLLRPGKWEIDDVIQHYREQHRHRPEIFGGRVIDYRRIEALKTLGPVKCYVGNDLWSGYVVFEFKGTGPVVLDCPVEGNAIYVLSGDWKKMVGHSKAYLRNVYPNSYIKIAHKGDWLDRVLQAL